MVRIPGFHPGDPGSSPGVGIVLIKVQYLLRTNGQELLLFLHYIINVLVILIPYRVRFPFSPVAQLVRA